MFKFNKLTKLKAYVLFFTFCTINFINPILGMRSEKELPPKDTKSSNNSKFNKRPGTPQPEKRFTPLSTQEKSKEKTSKNNQQTKQPTKNISKNASIQEQTNLKSKKSNTTKIPSRFTSKSGSKKDLTKSSNNKNLTSAKRTSNLKSKKEVLDKETTKDIDNSAKKDLIKACIAKTLEKKCTNEDLLKMWNSMPIHLACVLGDMDAVKYFVKNQEDINQIDSYGNTPLSLAILNNHIDIANFLIENGAKAGQANRVGLSTGIFGLNSGTIDSRLSSPQNLMTKTVEKDKESKNKNNDQNTNLDVEKSKPDSNLSFDTSTEKSNNKNPSEKPIIDKALKNESLSNLNSEEKTEKQDEKTNLKENSSQIDRLNFSINGLIDILFKAGASEKMINEFRLVPLHILCANGHIEAVEFLIKNGIDVNKKDENGITPMQVALYSDHPDIAMLLRENGAKIDSENEREIIEAIKKIKEQNKTKETDKKEQDKKQSNLQEQKTNESKKETNKTPQKAHNPEEIKSPNNPADAIKTQEKVSQIIKFANLLPNKNTIKVIAENNENSHLIYQLKVAQQQESSCGIRALYNATILKVFFCKNKCISDLSYLINTFCGSNELQAAFAKEAFNAKITRKNGIPEEIFVNFEKVNGFPVEVDSESLESLISYYKSQKNTVYKMENIDIMPGYMESFNIEKSTKNGVKDHLVGFLNSKEIGYIHGFVILDGEFERGSFSASSMGHYISLIVIKTNNNEYSWFILDSINSCRVNDDQIKAYICKFQGKTYEKYENYVKNKKFEKTKKQEFEDFNRTELMIDSIIKAHTKIGKNESQIIIPGDILKYLNAFNTSKNTLPLRDGMNRFFDDRMNMLTESSTIDQEEKNRLTIKINYAKTLIGKNCKLIKTEKTQAPDSMDNEAKDEKNSSNNNDEKTPLKSFCNLNGINYISVKTVNQLNESVNREIQHKYNTINPENIFERNGFNPNAASGALSFRNADLMSNHLRTKDIDEKVRLLKVIENNGNARVNLKKFFLDEGRRTSYLNYNELIDIISEYGLQENITVVNSSLQAEDLLSHFKDIREKFEFNNQYHHVFIINSADILTSGFLDKKKAEIESNYNKKVDQESFENLKNQSSNHWYVLALQKNGDEKNCFIIDTHPESNKMQSKTNSLNFKRNCFFCERIFNGKSEIQFRDTITAIGEELFKNNVKIIEKKEKQSDQANKSNDKEEKNKQSKNTSSTENKTEKESQNELNIDQLEKILIEELERGKTSYKNIKLFCLLLNENRKTCNKEFLHKIKANLEIMKKSPENSPSKISTIKNLIGILEFALTGNFDADSKINYDRFYSNENDLTDDDLSKQIYSSLPEKIRSEIELRQIIKERESICIILHGPNGTGKTSVGKAVAKELGLKYHEINCFSVSTKYESSRTENFDNMILQKINTNEPCVIMFDEADSINDITSHEDPNKTPISKDIGNFLDKNKFKDIIIFFTTNHYDRIPKTIKSKSKLDIKLELPNETMRETTLKYILKKQFAKHESNISKLNIKYIENNLNWRSIVKNTDNFSVRQLELLIKEIIGYCILSQSNKFRNLRQSDGANALLPELTITNNLFEKFYKEIREKDDNHAEHKSTLWEKTKNLLDIGAKAKATVDLVTEYGPKAVKGGKWLFKNGKKTFKKAKTAYKLFKLFH